MNPNYTTAQMISDIMATIQDNAPPIVASAIVLATANFIIAWFLYSLSLLTRESFRGR